MAIRLTIIGAGPGGYTAAIRAAQNGAQVTIVESDEVGGTCLNRGCIPTKALIASAETLERIRSASEFGIEIPEGVRPALDAVRLRTTKIVSTQVKGIRGLFKSWGITLEEGRGSLHAPGVVRVIRNDGTETDVHSDRIIIATGSRPAEVPGISFDGEHVISSDDAVLLKRIPKSLLIIGAGVIGSEFAFIYRTFGAEVTIVEMMPRALATEDEEMAEIVSREFKKAKIRLITNVKVEKTYRDPGGILSVGLSNGQEVKSEMILVSVGRSMNSQGLRLEDAGVKTGKRGEILVNEKLETSVPGIYAIGDVTGRIMLAHVASQQGLTAVENALGGNLAMDYSVVPAGIFTMPEIGSVGVREFEARERGINYRVGRFPYRTLGKAHAMGEIVGMVKIICDGVTDKVLGVHICGAHASDMVHEGALAIKTGITAAELGSLIHAHPTLAEAVGEAAEDVHHKAIHVPKK